MPPAHGGDAHTYEAEGTFSLTLTLGGLVADWSAVDEGSKEQGSVDLHEDSRVMVLIGDQPSPRLDMHGQRRPAYQATYRVADPAHPRPLDVADEWLDAETGSLVQANQRVIVNSGESDRHQIRFTRVDRPPLLLAPLFWERDIQTGLIGTVEFPIEHPFPPSPSQEERVGRLEYEVTKVYSSGAECLAQVEFQHNGASSGVDVRLTGELTLSSNTSLPVKWAELFPPEWETPNLQMTLVQSERGHGPQLPLFKPGPSAQSSLKLLPPQDRFLAETAGVFDTSFPEALGAIKNDSAAGVWLSQHPGAVPAQVKHRLGKPGSNVVDSWEVHWIDSDRSTLSTKANKVVLVPSLDVHRVEVTTAPGGNVERPPEASQLVSLAALAGAHRDLYGVPAETLYCQLWVRTCEIGTHNSTRMPYEADVAAGTFFVGLMAWTDRGLLLQEDSVAAGAIGPPAKP